MTRAASVLLGLLKSSLGYEYSGAEMRLLSCEDWNRLVDLAFDNGVAALAVDGLQRGFANDNGGSIGSPTNEDENGRGLGRDGLDLLDSPELEDMKYEWFGSVLQAEEDYSGKFAQASRFAAALAEKGGVKCFVLKGMAFAQYYPVPEHRECGDCDVYLGEGWAVGNDVAVSIGGRYDSGTRKHSHLFLGDLMIENHRYITNSGWTRRRDAVESLLRRRLEEGQVSHIRFADSRSAGDSGLLCPCDHFNALFLLIHAVGNFTSSGMSLRMIYDWAALLKGCQDSLDWKQLYVDMDVCGVRTFADVMTSICVEYLGLVITNPSVTVSGNRELVDEVLRDVMEKGIFASSGESFSQKVVKMFRRYGRYHHYRILLSAPWWKVVCWSILDKFSSGIRKAAK